MNGAKMAYYMTKKNIKNYELAEQVGVTKEYISDLKRGIKTNPTLEVVIKIADALGTTIDEIVRP